MSRKRDCDGGRGRDARNNWMEGEMGCDSDAAAAAGNKKSRAGMQHLKQQRSDRRRCESEETKAKQN